MVDKPTLVLIITKDEESDDPFESSVRSYSPKARISNYPSLKFRLPLQEIEDAQSLSKAGPIGAGFARRVNRIDGPDILGLDQYEAVIGIALAYTWEEVEPAIIAALEEVLQCTFDIRFRINHRPKSFLEMLHHSMADDDDEPPHPFGGFIPQA